jgi:type IV secretory pathway component VirB8
MQSIENEKVAARLASRQMRTAALVIILSLVLVFVLVALIVVVGHVRIF